MTERDDGGLAFPSIDIAVPGQPPQIRQIITGGGMSLRDYFAAQVMAECMTIPLRDKNINEEKALLIATAAAYRIADAMLKARKA